MTTKHVLLCRSASIVSSEDGEMEEEEEEEGETFLPSTCRQDTLDATQTG
jgi:hypothetical protein